MIKQPYPYFGGKMAVVNQIWKRFGDVPNFVDPFFGGGSALWGNPKFDWYTGNWKVSEPIETVNDLNGYIANFWRAVSFAPLEVARFADAPVNEVDLYAKHIWLVNNPPNIDRLQGDPDYFDAKIAGWWVWGMASWIGGGFVSGNGPWTERAGMLVNSKSEVGINRQLPHLGRGRGIDRQLPHLGDRGRGINRKLPHLGNRGRGQCAEWTEWLQFYFTRLKDRLRRVRVCCGDWTRVVGNTPTHLLGLTAVLLDPPYAATDRATVYNDDCCKIALDVQKWAIEAGDNPKMRIALCGYRGDYEMPDDWEQMNWSAKGGYEGQAAEMSGNRHREVVWFSPHCLKVQNQLEMFR